MPQFPYLNSVSYLHRPGACCSAPPWRTGSPSTPQCASGSPGAAPQRSETEINVC